MCRGKGRGISRPGTSQNVKERPPSNRRKVEDPTSSSTDNSAPEVTEPPAIASQPRVTSRVTRSTFRGARGQEKSTSRLQEDLVPTEELISSSEGESWDGTGTHKYPQIIDFASHSTHCPECGQGDEDRQWVQYNNPACEAWYHVECTDIDPEEYGDLCAITWFCKDLLSSLLIL